MSSAPIQFRFVVTDDGNGNDARRLEWRHRFQDDSIFPGDGPHGREWSGWEQVPELGLVEACKIDEEERWQLQMRQAEAIYGLRPQPAAPGTPPVSPGR